MVRAWAPGGALLAEWSAETSVEAIAVGPEGKVVAGLADGRVRVVRWSEADEDVDRISVAFEEAEREQRPVACLMGAEWSWT